MNLLLVEDEDPKRRQVEKFLAEKFPKLNVHVATSLIGSLRAVKEIRPSVIILDMTLPNYDVRGDEGGGALHPFGGEEFLRQLQRFKIRSTVIVFTQFVSFGDPPYEKGLNEVDDELRRKFGDVYKGAVYYHASRNEWKGELEDRLVKADPGIATCR